VIYDNYQFIDINLNRDGSPQDRKNFKEAFELIGYIVVERVNLTAKGIITDLLNIRRNIKSNILRPNSFVVIFLTHGHESIIYGIDNEYLEIRDIMQLFSNSNCKPLKDILKLILISACRGGISKIIQFLEKFYEFLLTGKIDNGVLYKKFIRNAEEKPISDVLDFYLNSDHKNFFICYSTIFGMFRISLLKIFYNKFYDSTQIDYIELK
jgi:hypothetical protein